MDLSLPASLLSSPMPLISLLGLESLSPSLASSLFSRFASNRGEERVALRFRRDDDEGAAFPIMKPKRTNYDWFIPKGVLKRNWMDKHLHRLPSVAVVVVELAWSDPEWTQKKTELVNKVQRIRDALSGRTTKIVVALLQREPSLIDDDITTSERASALCSACELSARSLFVLPIEADNVDKYVVRLENAFYELAQNYYHQEIRAVKSHRDHLTKTTHLYLFVRHQYKAGFLNELKRDFHAAYKHYCQAYSLLMEVRASDTNIMEVKTVAGFISYKICRLAFRLNLPRDAISQFRKHMDIFQHKVGLDALAFEHKGWQSRQCEYFADVFNDAIKEGLSAIQTQHPGLYYQQAAQYAIVRRELCEELCSEATQPPQQPNPLEQTQPLEFFGQRPWRPGKVSLEPPDMELENAGIQALLYHERTQVKHSEDIIALLRKAIQQFKLFKSPRSQSHLTVTMAEELISSGRFNDALQLLLPVMRHYRNERWRSLLDAVLMLGLKSAFLLSDLPLFLFFSLDLCSRQALVSENDKARVGANVVALLNGPKCPSYPTFDATDDVPATASMETALATWKTKLESLSSEQAFEVDLGTSTSSISARVHFIKRSFQVDEEAVMQVCLLNDNYFDINVRELTVRLSIDDFVTAKNTFLLGAKSGQVLTLTFQPTAKDVGHLVKTKSVELLVGNGNLSVWLIFSLPSDKELKEQKMRSDFIVVNASEKEDERFQFDRNDFDAFSWRPHTKVVQKAPKLKMSLIHSEPALVNEWYMINIDLQNKESQEISQLSMKANLVEANDPTIADTTAFTFDFEKSDADNNNIAEHFIKETMSSESSKSIALYVHTSTVGQRDLSISCSYSVFSAIRPDQKCHCSIDKILRLTTMEPFEIDLKLMSLGMRKLSDVSADEPFLVKTQLRSISPHLLTIEDSMLETKSPITSLGSKSTLKEVILGKGAEATEVFAFIVKQSDLDRTRLDLVDFVMGKYKVKYRRQSLDSEQRNKVIDTSFDLGSVHLASSSIYVETHLPPFGIVHRPLTLRLVIYNRTSKLHEFSMTVEPSEAFMLSGCKQHHFKIVPQSQHSLSFVLYPLVAGNEVSLPLIRVQSARPAHAQDAAQTLERLLPKTMTIMPKQRDGTVVNHVTDHVAKSVECRHKHVVSHPSYEGGVKVVKAGSKA